MSSFLDFVDFDLDFDDFLVFFGLAVVSDMMLWSVWSSRSTVGASDVADCVERREDALEVRGFLDREVFGFLLANTKKEQSEDRR